MWLMADAVWRGYRTMLFSAALCIASLMARRPSRRASLLLRCPVSRLRLAGRARCSLRGMLRGAGLRRLVGRGCRV